MLFPAAKDITGFTLLELLVAVAILTIVALTSLSNNSRIISNNTYLHEKTLAHWVAMNKAAELRLAGAWLTGEGEGSAIMADRKWQWTINAEPTRPPPTGRMRVCPATVPETPA